MRHYNCVLSSFVLFCSKTVLALNLVSFTTPRARTTQQETIIGGTASSRREFCYCWGLASLAFIPIPALAGDDDVATAKVQPQLPYAPFLENLLPACRVRIYIDDIIRATKSLQNTPDQQEIWTELEERLLIHPPTFVTTSEASSSKTYLQVNTWSSWNRVQSEQQKRTMDPFNEPVIDPVSKLRQGFEQWGEQRQWKILRERQLALEKSNDMRAAFNAYTNNLVFGESYVFTGSSEERKRRIRNDDLPDVTSVIRSDLDLRDLYRNQVLTAIDDAKAELQYQLTSADPKSVTELADLMQQAKKSCDEWFRFVPDTDVSAAMIAAQEER